ncbi:uncharacterized protein LOC110007899 isoform X1 [Amborella trichopoda]|uniref:uncharacterized protein LOC110007899 isoform X1 n=1 Tax=Amborella trichopoda TaxID=13333 RepID=UPI0009BEBEFF|nr:uncharacterized protein LOC110007899 isoform X1 [Amborella trichopoda]XP_020527638.1 uncharacterized protein LOC110007899 isoform X1 [Amborella trichopoda]XP_020527639.1 uncharacterized protein LOC110007899 isoform X1 [Amborella trichopoda]XP_020527640.1 uncharacterized protein LOC110007899 isoform X1 [Amborella trichopoda]XP_020527641.1 uncharacterized protein LOC110007899 isoform X1 [Amborella trichopoda]XP_020527642.1 uncharacterized protein LOC110007899 isoform X1 [Amborella trichopoda]|eukprot:XP_020527637.1 uncharacterized protein LOC110007899 isoform X1 [Amborella trichopoda]
MGSPDEEDFYLNLSRRELQSLCKKHGLPANRSQSYMAESLISLFKEKEHDVRGDSCTKNPIEERPIKTQELSVKAPLSFFKENNEVDCNGNVQDTVGTSKKRLEAMDPSISGSFNSVQGKEHHNERNNGFVNQFERSALRECLEPSNQIERVTQNLAPANFADTNTRGGSGSVFSRNACIHEGIQPVQARDTQDIYGGNQSAGKKDDESTQGVHDQSVEGCQGSFQFFVRSEEGINLYVDLNSSPADWIKKLKDEVHIYQQMHYHKPWAHEPRNLEDICHGSGDGKTLDQRIIDSSSLTSIGTSLGTFGALEYNQMKPMPYVPECDREKVFMSSIVSSKGKDKPPNSVASFETTVNNAYVPGNDQNLDSVRDSGVNFLECQLPITSGIDRENSNKRLSVGLHEKSIVSSTCNLEKPNSVHGNSLAFGNKAPERIEAKDSLLSEHKVPEMIEAANDQPKGISSGATNDAYSESRALPEEDVIKAPFGENQISGNAHLHTSSDKASKRARSSECLEELHTKQTDIMDHHNSQDDATTPKNLRSLKNLARVSTQNMAVTPRRRSMRLVPKALNQMTTGLTHLYEVKDLKLKHQDHEDIVTEGSEIVLAVA